jgi:hypothetical protein
MDFCENLQKLIDAAPDQQTVIELTAIMERHCNASAAASSSGGGTGGNPPSPPNP